MASDREAGFVLNPKLAEVGIKLGDLPLSICYLMDDARFPWLMLVPRRKDIRELLDLSREDLAQLMDEAMACSKALLAVSKPDKLNIGTLGNAVEQMHFHVVARYRSDSAWPRPVWGSGTRQPYPAHMAGPLADKLTKALGL